MGYENFKWQKDGRNACFCHGIIVVSKNTKSSAPYLVAAFLMGAAILPEAGSREQRREGAG